MFNPGITSEHMNRADVDARIFRSQVRAHIFNLRQCRRFGCESEVLVDNVREEWKEYREKMAHFAAERRYFRIQLSKHAK